MDEKEQKQLLMDLEVVMKSNDCPYIVQFYGALFKEVSSCLNWYSQLIIVTNHIFRFRETAGFVWNLWTRLWINFINSFTNG